MYGRRTGNGGWKYLADGRCLYGNCNAESGGYAGGISTSGSTGGSFPDEIIYGISGSRQYDRNFPDTYTKRCTGAGHTGNFHRRDKKCRKADRTGKHQ